MRPKEQALARKLESGLHSFRIPLSGIKNLACRTAFVEQLVESIRRIKYIHKIREQKLSSLRADPSSVLFDPIKAAVLRMNEGQLDEAFWLVFLSVHFGKHRKAGWRLARDVYGGLSSGGLWDWQNTSAHPKHFRQWLYENEATLTGDGVIRRFGNHRKYQSLDAWSPTGTGAAFESYVKWVAASGTHQMLFQTALMHNAHDPKRTFDYLYKSMKVVASFGRTAKFDYLTMVGKLGLAVIEPGRPYLQGATGPLKGARLLFSGDANAGLNPRQLEAYLMELGSHLEVGMQVLEDALCNWQKKPSEFLPFRG